MPVKQEYSFAALWIALTATLALPSPAGGFSERTRNLEMIEGLFGVTPAAGAVGDGRLTAQISREGTLTCVRWPNASYYEHVRYESGRFDLDPALDGWRRPHYGASPATASSRPPRGRQP